MARPEPDPRRGAAADLSWELRPRQRCRGSPAQGTRWPERRRSALDEVHAPSIRSSTSRHIPGLSPGSGLRGPAGIREKASMFLVGSQREVHRCTLASRTFHSRACMPSVKSNSTVNDRFVMRFSFDENRTSPFGPMTGAGSKLPEQFTCRMADQVQLPRLDVPPSVRVTFFAPAG